MLDKEEEEEWCEICVTIFSLSFFLLSLCMHSDKDKACSKTRALITNHVPIRKGQLWGWKKFHSRRYFVILLRLFMSCLVLSCILTQFLLRSLHKMRREKSLSVCLSLSLWRWKYRRKKRKEIIIFGYLRVLKLHIRTYGMYVCVARMCKPR